MTILRLSTHMGCLGALILAGPALASGRTITVDEFLGQVRQANQTIQSSASYIEASRLRESSSDLIFAPQLFGQLAQQIDEKPQSNPLAGKKTEATNFAIGVQKLWEFGLQSQLTYNINDISITRDDMPPLLAPGVPNPMAALGRSSEYSEGQTRLDLVQPLWRNWAGREYIFNREMQLAKLSMQRHGEQYKMRSLLAQAEFVYWQLALANEAVRTQQGALTRFQKIRDWLQSRVKMELSDRADLLQAEAGVKARRFELENSIRERTSLQRTFNSLRGTPGDKLEGELMPINTRIFTEVRMSSAQVKRLDVEVAKQAERVSEIEVEQLKEKFTPQLDVFGTLALNSDQEEDLSSALSGAFSTEKPTIIVGVKFSMPLDGDLVDRERAGLVKVSEASKADREYKEFTARQEWDDLQRQLSDAKTRLQLASEMESAQKMKLDYEKSRHERGRTTTYQILMFEQDYANAQLLTNKAKADVLGIIAKLKSFGEAI